MTADELAAKLHRYHMRDQASRLEFAAPESSFSMAWRADGRYPLALKGSIAHRLAVCWNVLEGMPTDLLEKGLLLELVQAIDAGDMERAKAAVAQMDRGIDHTNGRAHDCSACLNREADDDTEVVDVEEGAA